MKIFSFSSLRDIKMEQKVLIFGKEGIIKIKNFKKFFLKIYFIKVKEQLVLIK